MNAFARQGEVGEGKNIFQIYIQNEGYLPNFSFLAPKLRVQQPVFLRAFPSSGNISGKYGADSINHSFEEHIGITQALYMQNPCIAVIPLCMYLLIEEIQSEGRVLECGGGTNVMKSNMKSYVPIFFSHSLGRPTTVPSGRIYNIVYNLSRHRKCT